MSVRRLTAEQQREHVYAYVCVPHGSKARYLREHGLGPNDIRKWRAQVFAGSLELGLIPRGGQLVSTQESAALRRLLKENEVLRAQLAARDVEHERVVATKDADLEVQRAAVNALGKAIELLHHDAASKRSTTHPDGDRPDPPIRRR
ncbi:MAG: hypothetical protein WA988_16310 [Candidatus Nanopelagicales bacterium]